MRVIAFVASLTAPLLANAEPSETVKFNCDVAHIHAFKSDGMPFQAIEKDTKAQYVITIGHDAIRADRRSSSRNEVVVYRALMHNATEYVGALAPVRPSDAAIAVSKGSNVNHMHSGVITAVAGGSIKVTVLECLRAQ
jgi:hypothetical protein